ncbi:hypothetical protein C3L33_06198, partial [Rhododendron williamsianum]
MHPALHPDIIHNHKQPITLPELVSSLHLPPANTNSIHRLLRLLVHLVFFAATKANTNEGDQEGCVLTPSCRLLLKSEITNLSPLVRAIVDPVLVTPWQFLGDWFQGNETTAFETAHGVGMRAVFEGSSSLVDLGGGTGLIARIILDAHPHIKCTVFNLPHVIANLPESKNLSYVGGDSQRQRLSATFALSSDAPAETDGKLEDDKAATVGQVAVMSKSRQETTVFETAHGVGMWEFCDQNPKFNHTFNEAMASDSKMMNFVVGECKAVFEGLSSLVDVGGGTGLIARIILDAYPHIKCTVFDLPHCVLHNWSDEDCVKILKRCKEAIPSKDDGGKVIIIDMVIDGERDEHDIAETKLVFDILMMVLVTGRERSEKEWEHIFLLAGFSHYKITPIFGLRSLIEMNNWHGCNNSMELWSGVPRCGKVDHPPIPNMRNVMSGMEIRDILLIPDIFLGVKRRFFLKVFLDRHVYYQTNHSSHPIFSGQMGYGWFGSD